jgi:transposase
MSPKYTVNLSESEISQLQVITSKGKIAVRKFKRAQILLLTEEGHPDEKIAQMLNIGESTVHRTRQKCVELGLESALSECSRKRKTKKIRWKSRSHVSRYSL